jgi:hypothetical protein
MTTLLVGWCWGKRYSRVQVISVVILTVGCVLSALADGEGMVSFFLAAKLFGSYSAF